MALQPVKTAVVGCGVISSIYLQNLPAWEILDVVACADLDPQRAAGQAAKFHIPRAMTVDEVLADPEIELIVNLTVPAAHSTVGLAALRAGKSVYNEKPLATERSDGQLMLQEARARGLQVGGAPDTFLGGGLQTCRHVIDAGAIGQPVAATATMLSHGPEHWHPDPAFFFKPGGGPLFDMGPYYLTALIALFGPIRRVTGITRTTFPERTIHSGPQRGTLIAVETPTHIASVLDFASGPVVTLVTSFDVWDPYAPSLVIYGTEGTLQAPDPNTFGGPVRLRQTGAEEGREVAVTHAHTENSRGIGVADMAYALRTGRALRASGELALHVVDAMHAILEAAANGRQIELTTPCERPRAIEAGLARHQLDP
jgi:predicted dehydrogenase